MNIITEKKNVRATLSKLNIHLREALGKPKQYLWKFPGGGGRDTLTTWSMKTDYGHLTVGFDLERWESRSPILIALEPAFDGLSPVVEINIPPQQDRRVNGCIAHDDGGQSWLCHRGASLTATPTRIGKDAIHQYFQKWLVSANEGESVLSVIPVAAFDSSELPLGLVRFAEAVRLLKQMWSTSPADMARIRHHQGWRDTIHFTSRIQKITTERKSSHTYSHGPIQQMLQQYLQNRLAQDCRAVLNERIDLGILQREHLVAIFEVKTGMGNQFYSAIGQLFVYRHLLAKNQTIPLFLVLPASVASPSELRDADILLRELGLTLVVQKGARFLLNDGRELCDALEKQWLRQ